MSTALEWVGHYKVKISPLLPQGVLLIRKVAAFATFKKDTTMERQGEFTLSTLQRAVLAQARF